MKITSKREKWVGARRIPEDATGFDWAPFEFVYRVWRWRGHILWKKLLAYRQRDQYWLIGYAFGNAVPWHGGNRA